MSTWLEKLAALNQGEAGLPAAIIAQDLERLDGKLLTQRLAALGQGLGAISQRELIYCLAMGDTLLYIQEKECYRVMEPPSRTWTEFLEGAFPTITGRHIRTATDCIWLASSRTLRSLPPEDVAKIKSIGNAKMLVKLERTGSPINSDVIEMSQSLPTGEFKRRVGVSQGAIVRFWVPDKDAAEHLQQIGEKFLAQLSANGAAKLRDTYELLWKLGGDKPEPAVDLLAGMIEIEIANEASAKVAE